MKNLNGQNDLYDGKKELKLSKGMRVLFAVALTVTTIFMLLALFLDNTRLAPIFDTVVSLLATVFFVLLTVEGIKEMREKPGKK